ncbi:MAG: hypothetical protein M1818_003239 [Claussenomyces sp. TS43310]|nr:MAG: hypothetical protein M1818_003239 [Claussenomyces sp. TS43310]
MSEQKPRARDSDFSQRWVQHLRHKTKTTAQLACPLCSERPVFQSDGQLWDHVLQIHPENVPSDPENADQYRETVKARALTGRISSVKRPAEPPPKSHAGTSGVETGNRAAILSSAAWKPQLTEDELLRHDRKAEPGDSRELDIRDPSGEPSRKKAAIGQGSSPCSSVRTTRSDDDSARRSRADLTSVRQALISTSITPASPPRPVSGQRYEETSEFQRRAPATSKRLFNPQTDSPPTSTRTILQQPKPQHSQQRRYHRSHPSGSHEALTSLQGSASPQAQNQGSKPLSGYEPGTFPSSVLMKSEPRDLPMEEFESPRLILAPVTKPITQEQLIAEVKGIYAGLVMVEGKCIQVDLKQAQLAREALPGQPPKLNAEQWSALTALHRTLLHEHHDFFLASQHPSATPAVKRLAIKYAMPARLWKHGIHAFLELQRNRLPDCLDHMLAFIYLAYSMMTLLYETVPAFKETWIECLGDLGRYRMAIEDANVRDREVWTQVARQWYVKASNMSPATGRLYHHLAILARPNTLQQLYFYGKALSVPQPFVAAKDSVLTLFEPVLDSRRPSTRSPLVITAYIKLHAIIFTRRQIDMFDTAKVEYSNMLDNHIERVNKGFLEQGYYFSISDCQALIGYSSSNNQLMRALSGSRSSDLTGTEKRDVVVADSALDVRVFEMSLTLFNLTASIILDRPTDPNVLSFVHCTLVFVYYISEFSAAFAIIETGFPWQLLATLLNSLLNTHKDYARIESENIPTPAKDDFRPFPEDFAMRGLFWTQNYYPKAWFDNKNIDDENQYKDEASVDSEFRPERVLWLGCRLASRVDCINYTSIEHKFFIPGHTHESFPNESPDSDMDSVTIGDADDISMVSTRTPTWETGLTQVEDISLTDHEMGDSMAPWDPVVTGPGKED